MERFDLTEQDLRYAIDHYASSYGARGAMVYVATLSDGRTLKVRVGDDGRIIDAFTIR